jgi:DNA-binding MarR family transcriptional regulator
VSHTTAQAFGALALAVTDRMRESVEGVAGQGASGPAALAALDGPVAGGSIDSLRRLLGITHSGAVRLVDRLAAARLVERRIGADARAVSIHLTPEGRRVARRVLTAREASLEQVLAVLEPAQRAQLDGVLSTLLAGLAAGPDEALRMCRLCDMRACGHGTERCPLTRSASVEPSGWSDS